MQELMETKIALREMLANRFGVTPSSAEDIAAAVIAFILCSPKFSAYCARRTHPTPSQGVDFHLQQWSTAMSQATDAMAAAITNLQSQIKAGGVTADQVNTQIVAAVSPLTTQIQTILASEGDDASKISDIQVELAEFTTAFAPAASASSGSGASTGTPTGTPAPTAAPGA